MRRSLGSTFHVLRAAVLLLAAGTLRAQGECTAPKSSNVARMLGWFASPLAFSQLGAIEPMAAGAITIAGDLSWVPTPPSSLTHTDVCYTSKSEHTGLSPVLPRPRLIVGLGHGLSVEAMYLPPVTVLEATPNIGSLAVAWAGAPMSSLGGAHLTFRAHGTIGFVRGPITCPRSAIQQQSATSVCYARNPSEDTYRPNVLGAEAAIAGRHKTLSWYGGAGFSSLMPRFQVGYRDLNGVLDNTIVKVDLTRVTLFTGLDWRVRPSISLSAQLYSVPEDATTVRAGAAWRLR